MKQFQGEFRWPGIRPLMSSCFMWTKADTLEQAVDRLMSRVAIIFEMPLSKTINFYTTFPKMAEVKEVNVRIGGNNSLSKRV